MTSSTLDTPKLQTKAMADDFASTFAAFKSANDQRLAEIETTMHGKGQADPLTEAKVARIDAALDAQSKSIANLAHSLSGGFGGTISPTSDPETKSAWSSYIRAGETSGLEGKSIGSTDVEGTFIAPIETEARIDTALTSTSAFRRIASVRKIGAGLFRKPVAASGASAGWAGETDTRIETQAPNLTLLDFPTGELYAMPAATQALLDDTVADVDAWLAEEVRDVFAAQESAAFISGDGIKKPRGFLDYAQYDQAAGASAYGQIGTIGTGTDGDFDGDAPLDAIMDLIYAPQSRYRPNANFVMNRRTLSRIRKFKDADGNYVWQPAVAAGDPSTLLGYSVVEMEDMPDMASGSTPIAFGDFRRGYLVVDRQGVQVLRDPYSAKPFVLFYTTKRVGGGVQDFEAIKLLKLAA